MQLTPDFIFAAGIAAVAFLAGLLYLRSRPGSTRRVGKNLAEAPAKLRFTCASCHGKFTHSRRTLNAWQKGARSFHCSACHTRTLSTRPAPDRPSAFVPDKARPKKKGKRS